MKIHAKNFCQFVFFVLLIFSASTYAAECQLGKRCYLVGSDFIYFPVLPSDGLQYLCSLKSDIPEKIIEVIVMPGKNFSFEGRKISAGHAPTVFEIEGKFLSPAGEGEIIMKNVTSTNGTATCAAD